MNAGAGVQRLCTEHRVRAVKLTAVLCTHLNSDSVGGLPGLAMTAADGGRPTFHCIGPPGLKAVERASRPFCRRDFFAQRLDEVSVPAGATCAEASYPGSVTVVAAAVRPLATTEAGAAIVTDSGEPASKRPRIDPASLLPATSDAKTSQSVTKHFPPAAATVDVSFIFQAPGQRGKFDASAAAALGVPKGRLCGDLHAGRSVTLPDGVTVVHPHQVVGASKPPLAVAVLQCSTLAHLPCLMEHPAVAKLLPPPPTPQDGSNNMSDSSSSTGGCNGHGSGIGNNDHFGVPLVVHLASKSVVESPAYRAFLARFAPATRHWLATCEAPVAMAGMDARLLAGADADSEQRAALVATAPDDAAAGVSGNGSTSSHSAVAVGEQQPPWLLPGSRIPVASPYRASSLATLRLRHLLPDLFPLSRKPTLAGPGTGASADAVSIENPAVNSDTIDAGASARSTTIPTLPPNCGGVLPLLRFVVEPARFAGEVWDEVKGSTAQGDEATREATLWQRALELGIPKALDNFCASAAAAEGGENNDGGGKNGGGHDANNTKEPLFEAPAAIPALDVSCEPTADAPSIESTATSATAKATVVDQVASTFDPVLDARGAAALAAAGDNVRLTFLGTGSAAPSKHRNTSAIYLHIEGLPLMLSSLASSSKEEGSSQDMNASEEAAGSRNGIGEINSSSSTTRSTTTTGSRGLLLDCGEGTLGQMKRCWGAAECANVLVELEGIWVRNCFKKTSHNKVQHAHKHNEALMCTSMLPWIQAQSALSFNLVSHEVLFFCLC